MGRCRALKKDFEVPYIDLITNEKEKLVSDYSVEISKNISVNIKMSYVIDNLIYYQKDPPKNLVCISL